MSATAAHQPLRIAVLGAGRMGQEIIRAVSASSTMQVAGVWTRNGERLAAARLDPRGRGAGSAPPVGSDLQAVLGQADVAIDFTLPAATHQVLEAACRARTPLVCGVTGLDGDRMQELHTAARSIPLFYDRNMSLGIALLQDLVTRAAVLLGRDFEASVHETHHVHKVDAPSGTALKLGEALAEAREQDLAAVYRYARNRIASRTSPDDIVFSATRTGEVAGEHEVRFQSETEVVTLRHQVTDRRVFAHGALRAAQWLVGRPAGLYGMSNLCVFGGTTARASVK